MPSRREHLRQLEQAIDRLARQRVVLRLYIAGTTPHSMRALRAIIDLCEDQLGTRYELEVVDVYQQPSRARSDQISALPTLIRLEPKPVQRFVGDLSNPVRILRALGLVRNITTNAKAPRTTTKPPRH